MRIIAIGLIVLGAIGLTYGAISFTHPKKIIDAGPIQVTADKTESMDVSPWLGALLVVGGVVLLVTQGRKSL